MRRLIGVGVLRCVEGKKGGRGGGREGGGVTPEILTSLLFVLGVLLLSNTDTEG